MGPSWSGPPPPPLQGICVTHKEKSMDRVQLCPVPPPQRRHCVSSNNNIDQIRFPTFGGSGLGGNYAVKMIPKKKIMHLGESNERHTQAQDTGSKALKGWSKQTLGKVYRWLYYAILCKGHLKARADIKEKKNRKRNKEKEVVGWNIYGDVYESLSSCTPEIYNTYIYFWRGGGEEKTERRGKIVEGEKFMSVWSFSVKQRRRIWAIMQNRFVGCVRSQQCW